ncbi:PaaX family transcriptional regulator C-terminal domain-containing protein [Streptomyces spectabilis]|uniref:Phenylacetic acid degradation operon negative regulatory protein n=1 Tax=Streptomyces spectabilis TaxID=68270 RepID=A0A5P2XK94_STRST|nr:PaaX family transcriptional regulator C-terminal domain-containing protein [Streptomyces spectabilis]MBB5102299.1 phenylacetic acid degradation operon negative regulatory protein [Streptomyces spectabilis]MCI3907347.1 transcriptional regulator [Streptomyces spectabilis]QEV64074.1 transcriptional regulator [Streptomyces spectabilis]GGV29974.1 putative repressor in the phenylacetic acid catabolism [Streptomyces spectabilis]
MSTTAREIADASADRPEIPTRLLVHALVREDGTVDAGELYTVANVLGMSDQQVRLCVKRLVGEGRFTHEGRGRKAVLRAVADVTGSLAPDAAYVRHAYRQDQGLAPWDGTWHLFAFAVPESSRAARDTLRDTLLHLGAAPVQGGLYVCANAVEDLVEAQARHLGVLPSVTFLTSRDLRIGGLDAPRELAASLWPLPEIAERHDRLAAFAASCLAVLDSATGPTDVERLTLAVTLASAFSAAMEPDPLLPPELLPEPWPGSRARALTARCWARLLHTRSTEGRSTPRLFRLYEDALADAHEQEDGERVDA